MLGMQQAMARRDGGGEAGLPGQRDLALAYRSRIAVRIGKMPRQVPSSNSSMRAEFDISLNARSSERRFRL